MQSLRKLFTMGGRGRGALLAATLLALTTVLAADTALAGKPSSSRCRTDKNCKEGVCVRENPQDRQGVCCRPRTCSEEGAECGLIDDGCGGEPDCGPCDGSCVDNVCVPDPTTTTTSSTSTTEPPTTTTLPPTTTTTTPETTTTTTVPPPANECLVDAECGSGCCDVGDFDAYKCGSSCCLGCWWSCFEACGCPSSPSCGYCMGENGVFNCPQAACGCPIWP